MITLKASKLTLKDVYRRLKFVEQINVASIADLCL